MERRPGSGTYLGPALRARRGAFGLLIPGLGSTDIFEPICAEMARSAQAARYDLLWGDSPEGGPGVDVTRAEELCRKHVDRRVSGVFFAPLEFAEDGGASNRRIAETLAAAGIPVVLLDRDLEPFPRRSGFDLVGIDNLAGGCALAQHLLERGCRKIRFVSRPGSAPTVEARLAGARLAAEVRPLAGARLVDEVLRSGADGAICANDATAAELMRGLLARGVRIPRDLKLAGFDDVRYAALLPVPLTTLRQPCRDLGAAAVRAMLERTETPALPARQILLSGTLVARASTR